MAIGGMSTLHQPTIVLVLWQGCVSQLAPRRRYDAGTCNLHTYVKEVSARRLHLQKSSNKTGEKDRR